MGPPIDTPLPSAHEAAMTLEIHHRIKNNLQIVASIINLYSREIADPVARTAFQQIQARVDALALIQRLVERSATGQTVDMQALLSQLTDQIRGLAHVRRAEFDVVLDIDACELSPDTATPLALFAVEVLSLGLFGENVVAAPGGRLTFARSDDRRIEMRIVHPRVSARSLKDGSPAPERLLAAYSQQLRAEWWLEGEEAECATLILRLPQHLA